MRHCAPLRQYLYCTALARIGIRNPNGARDVPPGYWFTVFCLPRWHAYFLRVPLWQQEGLRRAPLSLSACMSETVEGGYEGGTCIVRSRPDWQARPFPNSTLPCLPSGGPLSAHWHPCNRVVLLLLGALFLRPSGVPRRRRLPFLLHHPLSPSPARPYTYKLLTHSNSSVTTLVFNCASQYFCTQLR